MSEINWFYIENGNKVGPVPHGDLCAMFSGGKLGLRTMVWCAQFKDWTEASGISGFRELARNAPPPPPPFASVVAPPPPAGVLPAGPPPLPPVPGVPPVPGFAQVAPQQIPPASVPFASPVGSPSQVFAAAGFAGAPTSPAALASDPAYVPTPGRPSLYPTFSETPAPEAIDYAPAPAPARPWLRFWARVCDMWLLGLVITVVLAVVGFDLVPRFLLNTLSLLLMTVVEALCLSCWGTTPGKYLFNISVLDRAGRRLSFGDAYGRAFAVFLKGMGMGLFIIPLITQIVGYVRLSNRGITSWDEDGGFRVAHGPVGAGRATAAVLTMLLTFSLTVAIVVAAEVNAQQNSQAAAAYGNYGRGGLASVRD